MSLEKDVTVKVTGDTEVRQVTIFNEVSCSQSQNLNYNCFKKKSVYKTFKSLL